jgi:predicted amidophosphoribosyltransferase
MVFLLQCYYCEFPLMGEEAICPRCNHELLKCPNCTEAKGYLIPRKKLSHEERCPVCGYEVLDAQA